MTICYACYCPTKTYNVLIKEAFTVREWSEYNNMIEKEKVIWTGQHFQKMYDYVNKDNIDFKTVWDLL
jgi:hypothetical protein